MFRSIWLEKRRKAEGGRAVIVIMAMVINGKMRKEAGPAAANAIWREICLFYAAF